MTSIDQSPHILPTVRAEPLEVLKYPHPVLATPAAPAMATSASTRVIAQRMLLSMEKAPGYGLAANQIGVLRRIMTVHPGKILDDPAIFPLVMVNPVVLEVRGNRREDEGCLSIPGIFGWLNRPSWVAVEYMDLEGNKQTFEAEDYMARCLLHEVDHLDGILFWDRMSARERVFMKMRYFGNFRWL